MESLASVLVLQIDLNFNKGNQEGENGEVKEDYLEYWAALLNMWNFKIQGRGCQDQKFITDYRLIHECTRDCIKIEGGNCRKGYPNEIRSKIGWQLKYPSRIFPRVQSEEEAKIFPHDRDIVKFFGSSCIVELAGSQRVIDYLTKYMHKSQKSTDDVEQDEQGKEEESKEGINEGNQKQSNILSQNVVQIEKDEQIEKSKFNKTLKEQMNNLLNKYMSKKITSLSEAYSDLLDFPLFQTSFQTIRIPQLQLSQQYKFTQSVIKSILLMKKLEKQQSFIRHKTSLKQSTWIKYLARPKELELLNLYEFVQNFIWYGNKQKFKRKSENLKEGAESQYLIDLNGQLVKMREKPYEVILNLSSVYYIEEVKYEQNLFYLAMLQLYWPHRQDLWYLETNDTIEGFKIAYHKFYNQDHLEYEIQQFYDDVQFKWLEKCRIFTGFKSSVDNYKQLSNKQKSFWNSFNSHQTRKRANNFRIKKLNLELL